MKGSQLILCCAVTILLQQFCEASPRNFREFLTQRRSRSEDGETQRRRLPDLTAMVASTPRRQNHHHGHRARATSISRSLIKQISVAVERARKKAGRDSVVKSIPPMDAVYSGKGRSAMNTIKRVPNAPNIRPRMRTAHRRLSQRRFSLPTNLAVRRRQGRSAMD